MATLAVFFANGLGLGAWATAIPTLKGTLTLTDGQLSVALFALACGAFISMPIAGRIGSRVRTGRATLIAGMAFASSLVLPALTGTLPTLCVAAWTLGACSGATDVLMNVHASGIERRRQSPIMSSFHAAFSVGTMAGAVLGGLLALHGAIPQLGAAGAVCIVVLLVASCFLRAGDLALARSTLAVPHGALVILGLLAMLSLMIEGAVADWSGTLLAQGGADPRSTTFGYGAFSCAMAGGRMAGDWLIKGWGPTTIVRWGGVLTGLGLTLVATMPTPLTGAVGFGLVGLGLANVVPTVFGATGRMGASAAAAVVTTGFAGMLLGPAAIGVIATAVNLRWGMAVLAAGAVTISILARAVTSAPDIHNDRDLGQ